MDNGGWPANQSMSAEGCSSTHDMETIGVVDEREVATNGLKRLVSLYYALSN